MRHAKACSGADNVGWIEAILHILTESYSITHKGAHYSGHYETFTYRREVSEETQESSTVPHSEAEDSSLTRDEPPAGASESTRHQSQKAVEQSKTRCWRISDDKIAESSTSQMLSMKKDVYLLFYELQRPIIG